MIQKGVKTLIEQHMQPVLLDPSQGQWTGNTVMLDQSQSGPVDREYCYDGPVTDRDKLISLHRDNKVVLYCIVNCYDGPVTDRASGQTTLLCVCVLP